MRHGDLNLLLAVAVVSAGAFLLMGARSTPLAVSGAQGAQADEPFYYNDNGISPADADPRYPSYNYDQITSDNAGYYNGGDNTIYVGGPLDNTNEGIDEVSMPDYWPAASDPVYTDPITADPAYTYDPYTDVTYIDETWYETAFPGVGRTFTYLVPPVFQSAPIITAPVVPPRAPTCSIVAQPSEVPYGGSAVVSWTSQNAARSVLSGVGDVAGTGSRTFSNLTFSQTIALTVSGLGGSNTCSTAVSVDAPRHVVPTCVISAHPDTIHRGESTNLAWIAENAAVVNLSGFGPEPQSGGVVVAPNQTTTFTLTATSTTGDATACRTTITVQ